MVTDGQTKSIHVDSVEKDPDKSSVSGSVTDDESAGVRENCGGVIVEESRSQGQGHGQGEECDAGQVAEEQGTMGHDVPEEDTSLEEHDGARKHSSPEGEVVEASRLAGEQEYSCDRNTEKQDSVEQPEEDSGQEDMCESGDRNDTERGMRKDSADVSKVDVTSLQAGDSDRHSTSSEEDDGRDTEQHEVDSIGKKGEESSDNDVEEQSSSSCSSCEDRDNKHEKEIPKTHAREGDGDNEVSSSDEGEQVLMVDETGAGPQVCDNIDTNGGGIMHEGTPTGDGGLHDAEYIVEATGIVSTEPDSTGVSGEKDKEVEEPVPDPRSDQCDESADMTSTIDILGEQEEDSVPASALWPVTDIDSVLDPIILHPKVEDDASAAEAEETIPPAEDSPEDLPSEGTGACNDVSEAVSMTPDGTVGRVAEEAAEVEPSSSADEVAQPVVKEGDVAEPAVTGGEESGSAVKDDEDSEPSVSDDEGYGAAVKVDENDEPVVKDGDSEPAAKDDEDLGPMDCTSMGKKDEDFGGARTEDTDAESVVKEDTFVAQSSRELLPTCTISSIDEEEYVNIELPEEDNRVSQGETQDMSPKEAEDACTRDKVDLLDEKCDTLPQEHDDNSHRKQTISEDMSESQTQSETCGELDRKETMKTFPPGKEGPESHKEQMVNIMSDRDLEASVINLDKEEFVSSGESENVSIHEGELHNLFQEEDSDGSMEERSESSEETYDLEDIEEVMDQDASEGSGSEVSHSSSDSSDTDEEEVKKEEEESGAVQIGPISSVQDEEEINMGGKMFDETSDRRDCESLVQKDNDETKRNPHAKPEVLSDALDQIETPPVESIPVEGLVSKKSLDDEDDCIVDAEDYHSCDDDSEKSGHSIGKKLAADDAKEIEADSGGCMEDGQPADVCPVVQVDVASEGRQEHLICVTKVDSEQGQEDINGDGENGSDQSSDHKGDVSQGKDTQVAIEAHLPDLDKMREFRSPLLLEESQEPDLELEVKSLQPAVPVIQLSMVDGDEVRDEIHTSVLEMIEESNEPEVEPEQKSLEDIVRHEPESDSEEVYRADQHAPLDMIRESPEPEVNDENVNHTSEVTAITIVIDDNPSLVSPAHTVPADDGSDDGINFFADPVQLIEHVSSEKDNEKLKLNSGNASSLDVVPVMEEVSAVISDSTLDESSDSIQEPDVFPKSPQAELSKSPAIKVEPSDGVFTRKYSYRMRKTSREEMESSGTFRKTKVYAQQYAAHEKERVGAIPKKLSDDMTYAKTSEKISVLPRPASYHGHTSDIHTYAAQYGPPLHASHDSLVEPMFDRSPYRSSRGPGSQGGHLYGSSESLPGTSPGSPYGTHFPHSPDSSHDTPSRSPHKQHKPKRNLSFKKNKDKHFTSILSGIIHGRSNSTGADNVDLTKVAKFGSDYDTVRNEINV